MVHQRKVGVRPWIELERTDHPLAVDQPDGLEEDRLRAIVTGLLHEYGRQGAPPKGGPATRLGNSGGAQGPPSAR
jgi:hypothetical protein